MTRQRTEYGHPKGRGRVLIVSSMQIVATTFLTQLLLSCRTFAWDLPSHVLQKAPTIPRNCDFQPSTSRREVLTCIASALVSSSALLNEPISADAADDKNSSSGLMTVDNVAELLHPIPTFAIVDPKGIPYMVVGEDAKVTGYFFTTYPEAARVLQLARTSADKAIKQARREGQDMEEIGENPWKTARISTVPLDLATTLVYKSSRAKGIYFKVAPAEEDVEDALAVTGDDDLAEGKVPLFYYEDFKINNKSPLCFRKKELEQAWRQENPKQDYPKLLVTELFSVLAELVKPGGADDDLRNLALLSPKESEKKRQECLKKSGNEPAFVIGQRIIVL